MLRRKFTAASLLFFAILAAGCGIPSPATRPPQGLEEVDRLLEGYRERGAFPGGVLAVGQRGSLVHLHPFGRLTYDADAPPVTAGTLYDLASLTKVVATTTMAMILVDEGKLDLDRPVRDFLPGFQGPGKEAVTVRHLLTHSSGLPAVAPLFKEIQGQRGLPRAHPGHGPRLSARQPLRLQRPRHHPPGRDPGAGGGPAAGSVRARAGARAAGDARHDVPSAGPAACRGSRPPNSIPGAAVSSRAKSTTRTPSPWAASPPTPGSSAPPPTSPASPRCC